jgi:hypothetical protein
MSTLQDAVSDRHFIMMLLAVIAAAALVTASAAFAC